MSRVHSRTIVVPCFDEEHRLDRDRFVALAREPGVSLLFVDDGSRDGTRSVLEALRAREPTIDVLALEKNGGKGEAVRRGMLHALSGGFPVVGFADADLSTPPEELVRLLGEVERTGRDVVVGSRVLMIGRNIVRKNSRHYLGRVFATIASKILEMPFYDTQCGAKFFRDVPALREALSTPFTSRWAFDIELLGRLRIGTRDVPGLGDDAFLEVPLETWVDVADSKLRFGGMARTLVDLAKIDLELARRRRTVGR